MYLFFFVLYRAAIYNSKYFIITPAAHPFLHLTSRNTIVRLKNLDSAPNSVKDIDVFELIPSGQKFKITSHNGFDLCRTPELKGRIKGCKNGDENARWSPTITPDGILFRVGKLCLTATKMDTNPSNKGIILEARRCDSRKEQYFDLIPLKDFLPNFNNIFSFE
ncbi:hypothetical protein CWI38_0420p0030 [Hamiltosporidium tvaerminnensis]|uniref:Ricin B lectin domain-containing protein n=2 Tax=Hamiltosporidium TaxID=1176354 RepID=A0A4Q9LC03_9MICR|nr:hypothetical protein LUQ84_000618 [Hamiltosporidium tvaerminnensis]TBT99556.1 hypothetical protein CWI39_1979p0020 [Hamiltosporidium magnivora]TBU03702.1 hypothetical protein CWI37_0248p0040 [Hamiltosporidium tvaerminnensis]TBU05383.1 hypothetical protein CWI36_0642p0020 [Hamiltosporidium magnivora]TBU13476.1 hypothetical protein CWI38_0420p0030 [Hamiltosporidium tvaerminnensis]